MEKKKFQEVPEYAFAPFEGELGGPLQEAVFPLVAIVNDILHPVGTAFAIHPEGMLITARHVLEYAASLSKTYGLYALYMSAANKVDNPEPGEAPPIFGGLFPIEKFWADNLHDVAVCLSNPPVIMKTGKRLQLRCIKLEVTPPRVGEHISAVGYYAMQATSDGTNLYEQKTAISTATVTEIFHVSRDKSAANYPCFHTDARFDAGMSGGPIMNENGNACGIVSRGMLPDLSLGASIWPAFGMQLDAGLEKTTLYEMAKKGIIDVSSIDALRSVDGGVSIHYTQKKVPGSAGTGNF